MLRSTVVACGLLLLGAALAQSHDAARALPRQTRTALLTEIAKIDSAGDEAGSIKARIQAAAQLKGMEAIKLLGEAAAIADSARDLWLEAEARSKLLDRYRAAGDSKRALVQALRIIELERQGQAQSGERAAAETAALISAHWMERDSLIAAHEQALAAERTALGSANKGIAVRDALLGSLGALAAVSIAILLIVLKRGQRKAVGKLRQELAGLHARISEMSAAMEDLQRKLERPVTAAPPPSPASPPLPMAQPGAAVPDPLVLALFKRQAPERIATLQAARAAGDHEKALRVLHSLRPQLDALDPDGLGVLCADLRAMPPANAGRDASLDRLIAGMNELLRRS